MVADSNSQIAWHRAQIKKHRETLKHLETARFSYGEMAGSHATERNSVGSGTATQDRRIRTDRRGL